eukprot:Sspe_Gene.68604::Locus_40450_Transcript_1_1_Confidence_1.000_Length_2386::g.68604::m.68604/K08582/CAPN15; calpain-15
MDELEALRAENAELRRRNAQLEEELRTALDSSLNAFQQYGALLKLTEKYASMVRGGAGAELPSRSSPSSAPLEVSVPKSLKSTFEELQCTPHRVPDPSSLTPLTNQKLEHESPPNVMRRGGTRREEGGSPPRGFVPRQCPIKKQRKGGVDQWAAKGTVLDTELIEGIPPPAFPGAEPMLQGGRIYRIVHSDGNTTDIAFYNGTRDMQFTLDYEFSGSSVVSPAGDDVEENGGVYSVTVMPGETKRFVSGYVNGYKMNMRYGYTNPTYLHHLKVAQDRVIAEDSERVHAMCVRAVPPPTDSAGVADLCALAGIHFVDPYFPPTSDSIDTPDNPDRSRPWIRLQDALVDVPVGLYPSLEAIEPTDIEGGALHDPWLLSAIAALAEDPRAVSSIFEVAYNRAQVTAVQDHRVGAYRLRLCQGGWWKTVVIDDWLPASSPFGVAFSRSLSCPGALWVSLLEKAFAKVAGRYHLLREGDPLEALSAMTGCGTARFDLHDGAWEQLAEGARLGYLTLLTAKEGGPMVGGMSYAVLKADEGMLLLRNAWGDTWCGEGGREADDGTFWVTWGEVKQYFECGGVCYRSIAPSVRQVSVRVRVGGTTTAPTPSFPNVMVALQCTTPCVMTATMHQDVLPEYYGAYCITVVSPQGTLHDSSHGGTFWKGRETVLRTEFSPDPHPYYIIPRCYAPEDDPPR